MAVTNPPVNALNERALDQLNTVVDHLARRSDVRTVIFTGSGTTSFVAGADIRQLLEMCTPRSRRSRCRTTRTSPSERSKRMRKPCIAAMNGVALGGGLEFALACHYRVAEPSTSFGQPEIRLQLLPGYGGTQRLPRLLAAHDAEHGLTRALEIILGGRTMGATRAREIGLVDEVTTGSVDVLTRSWSWPARRLDSGAEHGRGAPTRRLRGAARWPRHSASDASCSAAPISPAKPRWTMRWPIRRSSVSCGREDKRGASEQWSARSTRCAPDGNAASRRG